MDMIGKIRRLHRRNNKSEREIARITGLSRNTVSKWLHGEVEGPPKYRREEQPSKLTAFHESLKLALKADARRPRHERRTAKALYVEIKAAGYDGGYTRVTDFIRAWRQAEGQTLSANAFVPLAFELGEAYQFDWSEEGLVVGGIYYRAQVSHMKLCASRAFWLVAYPSQGHEMLFDAHTRSFAALGGVARRGIYDNMKTAVDKVKKGKGRVVNERFASMCAHYLVDPDFCNVASGWEKGVVEKNVQDSRRRIWIDAAKVKFGSFTGATGCGKTWLACALAQQAARQGFAVLYTRAPRLLEELRVAHGDGSFSRRLAQLARIDLLVIDDFAIAPITAADRNDLLELLDDRVGSRATLITSQLPVSAWHQWLDDPTLADAILDRIVHSAHKIALKGESLRKKQDSA